MRWLQIFGLILWRGGLLFVGAAVLFEAARMLLRFIDIPDQLQIGLGLAFAGFALVILSLIIERIRDLRTEGELRE
jgi:hypothetical protein